MVLNGNDRRIVRSVVLVATLVATASIWYLFLTSPDYPVGFSQNYGLPLTFHRVYRVGVERVFPRALGFDLTLATLTVLSTGFCIWRWSSSWDASTSTAYILVLACFAMLMMSGPHVPAPIACLLFLTLVLVIPAWCFMVGYSAWRLGSRLAGRAGALWVTVILVMALLGLGRWSAPHDVFYDQDAAHIPELVRVLSDDDPRVRTLAIYALGGLGPYDDPTATAILRSMSDPDHGVRSKALSLASQLGPRSAESVPILIEEFQEHGSYTFELEQLGPIAKEAVPALIDKLANAEGYTKLGICQALWKIERESSLIVPRLIELLDHDVGPIRRDAAELLGTIGPEAKAAVPRLQEMVDYVPRQDSSPMRDDSSLSKGLPLVPAPRQMTDTEFNP